MAEKVNKKAAERERLILENLQKLNATRAKDRRAAAYWLGEAAAIDAIPELVRVYQTDKDGSVRGAAAYALGQFRAVDQALEKGDQEKVEKLLLDVEKDGKYGSRGGRGRWARLALGLLLSLGGFYLLSWIFYGGPGGIAAAVQSIFPVSAVTPTPDLAELSVAATDLQAAFEPVRADLTTLQSQFTSVLAGNAPDCSADFNLTAPYALPASLAAAYPSLEALALRINEMQSSLGQAYAAFRESCDSGATLNAASVAPAYASLRPALEAAPQMQTALAAFGLLLTPSPTPLPTATGLPTATPVPPTATPLVTAIPTTDIRLTDPRRHLSALYAIVDQMIAPGGQAISLRNNWQDATTGNRPVNCGSRPPTIPSRYELSESDREASEALATVVNEINNGLGLLQAGWTNFVFACNASTTSNSAAQGLTDTQAIITLFELARQRLDAIAGA